MFGERYLCGLLVNCSLCVLNLIAKTLYTVLRSKQVGNNRATKQHNNAIRDRSGLFSSNVGLPKPHRSCSCPFKTSQALLSHTAILPRVMPIWGGSTKRGGSSPGCAPLPHSSYRAMCPFASPRTASFSCRACASRPAKQHEPDPPFHRDSRC